MSLEYRGCRVYYYSSRRAGGRVRRVYEGSGVCAELAEQLHTLEREERELDRRVRQAELDGVRNQNAELRRCFENADGLVAAALVRAGWHRVRRQWRKRRGTTVSEVATSGELSWVASEIAARAGNLAPDVSEKANRKDELAIQAVNTYLKNPAARALWGDLGRHVLLKWVDLYAEKNETLRRGVIRFASDLRAKLAGANPTALEVLLAERVVLAWVFVNWAEYQYAALVGRLGHKDHELYLKRIELANRNLLAAARALAKVRRSQLPDVLALVNVNPPPAR